MDAIHSMLKRKENMVKLGPTLLLRYMIVYEWCMKVGVMLNPPSKRDKECGVMKEKIV
jgi:hypothetical protein